MDIAAGEDLASKLRRVLYQHQVELESAASNSTTTTTGESSDNSTDSDDPTLSFISKMLMDDESEEDEADQDQISYHDLMNEFSTMINNTSSSNTSPDPVQVDSENAPQNSFEGDSATTVDIHWSLMQCARAVAANNSDLFFTTVAELKNCISPVRTPFERAATFFIDALTARLTKCGAQTYRAMSAGISSRRLLNTRMLNLPTFTATQHFANEVILRECVGAKRIHIVDYGIAGGFQWPQVIKYLSELPEGPPLLKITGVELVAYVEASQTGKRLTEFANSVGVQLLFTLVSTDSWEVVQPVVHPEETLVINSNLRLAHLKDDFMGVNNPRKVLFERIQKLRPKVFVHCLASSALSTPFFLPRFEEALRFYVPKLEYYKALTGDELEARGFLEKLVAKSIMNVLACEGPDWIDRPETYMSWDARARRAGLVQMKLDDELYQRAKSLWGGYKNSSENFSCGRDGDWMLLGWKNTVMTAMSAWQPQKIT